MGVTERTADYYCDNDDCDMQGCPGHTMTVYYHSVADSYRVSDGVYQEIDFDRNAMQAMLRCLSEIAALRFEVQQDLEVLRETI